MKNNSNDMRSRFLIGAVHSGSGKTTLTLGLLRLLRNRGVNVQPFKCGPDYIDTKYHEKAAGCFSCNLDTFLSSPSHVKELFHRYGADKAISVVEGVMGLFDGYERMKGSSGELAALLDIPVVLVVNARSMAFSAAALLYGFKQFRKEVRIVGVIFNFVGSESHYQYLKDACEEVGVEALGYLPKDDTLQAPSRHLGLTTDGTFDFDGFAEAAARQIEKTVRVDRLLEITHAVPSVPALSSIQEKGDMRIAVARDEAFNFMYHENLHVLQEMGAVTFFSPLTDSVLPEPDLVYFPGGYPELHLPQLSRNREMHDRIRAYVENGGWVWSECGGMMYLSASITGVDGVVYPMAGIFDQEVTMQGMKLALGYRQFDYKGRQFKGHEFHYSRTATDLPSETIQYNARNGKVDTKLVRYKNALGSYTHIYWGENRAITDLFK